MHNNKIIFESSSLNPDEAKLYFSNNIIQRNGKFNMTFPKFSDDSQSNIYAPIVEVEIKPDKIQEIKNLYQFINPEDEEKFRFVVGIDNDYSFHLVKIPKEKIKISIELEKLDDHREFLRKIPTYLTINHQENLPNVIGFFSSPPTEPTQPTFLQGKPESLCSITALRNPDKNSYKTFCEFANSLLMPRSKPRNGANADRVACKPLIHDEPTSRPNC